MVLLKIIYYLYRYFIVILILFILCDKFYAYIYN